MIDSKRILLPRPKLYGLILNLGGAVLFLLESDFLQKPLTDGAVIITLCCWLALFLLSITQLYISHEGLEIYLWIIPIRRVAEDRISCVEVIKWHDVTHVLFEIDNCPKFKNTEQNHSLWTFFLANMSRVVEYIPPYRQKDTPLEMIYTLFATKMDGDA